MQAANEEGSAAHGKRGAMQLNKWQRELKALNANPSRSLRRVLLASLLATPVVFWMTAIIYLYPWRDHGWFYGTASCVTSLGAVGWALFMLRFTHRAVLRTSLDDLAQTARDKIDRPLERASSGSQGYGNPDKMSVLGTCVLQ